MQFDNSSRNDNDTDIKRKLIRDICYLFHELSDYRHILGDLDYANEYPLPYWAWLNRVDAGRNDDRFIRSGILILFMAMLHDEFDGSGSWISQHIDGVSLALEHFVPEDDEMLRLSDSVLHGIQLLRGDSKPDDRFADDSTWAYNAVVRRYFQDSAR